MTKLFIREAELSDWLPVFDLMDEIHQDAPYSVIPYNKEDMKRMYKLAVVSNRHLSLVVSDKKHRVYGVLIATISKNWWGATVARDIIAYCNQPGWQAWLLRRYKNWAKPRCDIMSIVNTAGENTRYDRLIEKLGFTRAGSAFLAMTEN